MGHVVQPIRVQLLDADREFHRRHHVYDLAAEQGVAAVDDLDALVDTSASQAERAAFLDGVGV